jgi:hypothetical protein
MREITRLRKRAEAVGCRVRIFRRTDYRCGGKPVRYGLIDSLGELYASNLQELRHRIERCERIYAEHGTPNLLFGEGRIR